MRGIRVRWSTAAKAGLAVLVALLALQLLPSLLRPPEPPPLAPDIGLPRAAARERPVPRVTPEPRGRMAIGPARRLGEPRPTRKPDPAPPTPPPAPEPAPPPEPELVPPPPPEPAAPASDGSEEFAPH